MVDEAAIWQPGYAQPTGHHLTSTKIQNWRQIQKTKLQTNTKLETNTKCEVQITTAASFCKAIGLQVTRWTSPAFTKQIQRQDTYKQDSQLRNLSFELWVLYCSMKLFQFFLYPAFHPVISSSHLLQKKLKWGLTSLPSTRCKIYQYLAPPVWNDQFHNLNFESQICTESIIYYKETKRGCVFAENTK